MPIDNTSQRDPLVHLMGAMGHGPSQYIEEMERDGQNQIVHSDRLPRVNGGGDEPFLELGFTFGEFDTRDPLFRPATLPTGWKRTGSDHAMWSYIVDERGIERVSIFYKAAFYDREAFMNLTNVASSLANKFVYGDEPVKDVVIPWDMLTEEERAGIVQVVRIAAEKDVTAYNAEYVARAKEALRLVEEAARPR